MAGNNSIVSTGSIEIGKSEESKENLLKAAGMGRSVIEHCLDLPDNRDNGPRTTQDAGYPKEAIPVTRPEISKPYSGITIKNGQPPIDGGSKEEKGEY